MQSSIQYNSVLRIVAAVVSIATCIYVSIAQLEGVDFWLLAKVGQIISETRAIPDTLLFPFTEVSTEKFNAHEWLACLVFHWALRYLGEANIPFFTASLGLSFFILACRLAYIRSQSNIAIALLGGLAALVTENYRHTLRPELLALNLTAIYWIALERFRSRPTFISALSVAIPTVLWANTHGSFILAPLIASMYTAGIQIDWMRSNKKFSFVPCVGAMRFAMLTLGLVFACMVNPFGWELIQFVFKFSSDPALAGAIVEWSPTYEFYVVPRYWMIFAVWVLTLVAVALNIRRCSIVDLIIFLAFSFLAIKAVRFPVYLGLVAAYILPAYVPKSYGLVKRQNYLYVSVILLSGAGLALAMNFGNLTNSQPYSLGSWKFSAKMVETLKNPQMHGNVLTSMETGPELIYIAYPRLKPSIDSRVDSYGFDYLQYQTTVLLNDTFQDEFVKRYDVKYVLFQRKVMENFTKLNAWKEGRWKIVLMDRSAVLLRRSDVEELSLEDSQ